MLGHQEVACFIEIYEVVAVINNFDVLDFK